MLFCASISLAPLAHRPARGGRGTPSSSSSPRQMSTQRICGYLSRMARKRVRLDAWLHMMVIWVAPPLPPWVCHDQNFSAPNVNIRSYLHSLGLCMLGRAQHLHLHVKAEDLVCSYDSFVIFMASCDENHSWSGFYASTFRPVKKTTLTARLWP